MKKTKLDLVKSWLKKGVLLSISKVNKKIITFSQSNIIIYV